MTTFSIASAWIVDKDGNRREIPSGSIHIVNIKENLEGISEQVYNLSEAVQEMTFSVTLAGEATEGLHRMFRHMEYKRWVAPLRYRLQPAPRSTTIKVGGEYLTSKSAFMHRLLKGEE